MAKSLSHKGQIFSLDVIIAVLAFTTILVSSIVIWDYTHETISKTERRIELELATMNVLSTLLESPGSPSNWSNFPVNDFNESNVLSIGLTRNDSISLISKDLWHLDYEKISYLNPSTYNKTKKILGLAGHDFKLTINLFNGTEFSENYSVSGDLTNIEEQVVLTRYGLLNGEKTELVLKVGRHE